MSDGRSQTMTFRDYWRVIIRRKWAIVIPIVATVAAAVGLSFAQDEVYVGEARMLIQSRPGESLFGNDVVDTDKKRNIANEIEVLEGGIVRDQLIETLGLTERPPSVTGSSHVDTDVISVTVRSSDADTAAALANAYVEAYAKVKQKQAVEGLTEAATELRAKVSELQDQIDDANARLQAEPDVDSTLLDEQLRKLIDTQAPFISRLDQVQVDMALTSGSAQLIAPAVAPPDPSEPKPERNAAIAVVAGLLLGLGLAFIIDHFDDSISVPADLAKAGLGVPLLAVVPVASPPDGRPIAMSRPGDTVVDAYNAMRTNIEFVALEQHTKVIEVTSALPDDGKTTTATNLAVVLAQAGSRVVLVDADLRTPQLDKTFSLSAPADLDSGLADILAGAKVDSAASAVVDGLTVITFGTVQGSPGELLSSDGLRLLIEALKHRFDYVIIDTSATLPVSDAVAIARHVDGVLVVTRAGRTSLSHLRGTIGHLERVAAPVIGIVLNGASTRSARRYGLEYVDQHAQALPVVATATSPSR